MVVTDMKVAAKLYGRSKVIVDANVGDYESDSSCDTDTATDDVQDPPQLASCLSL